MSKNNLKNTICFDYSHNNMLTIESPSYADFTQFLFGSSFSLGKIQAGFSGIDKLEKYRMVVIGGPRESQFSEMEIKVLVEFVKKGGSLLIVHDEGGDYGANTNLSALTHHFGFEFSNNIVFDSMNFQGKQTRVIVKDFEAHPTTRNLDGIVQSSACSIKINKIIEADENIHIFPLARSSINAFHTQWDGEEWVKEVDAPRSVLASCTHFYNGRVIALCTVSMFSSLSSAYGYFALSNQDFLTSIFTWLLEPPESVKGLSRDEKLINIPLNYNLFVWLEKLVQEKAWDNIGDIVNFAVKFFKDDYVNIMLMGEERRKRLKAERKKQLIDLQKIADGTERKRQTKLLENESKILNLGGYEVDTVRELEDIMSSLRDITGGEVGNDINFNELKKSPQTPNKNDSVSISSNKEKKQKENCLEFNQLALDDDKILKKQLSSNTLSVSCEEPGDVPQNTVINEQNMISDDIPIEKKTRRSTLISGKEVSPKMHSLKARADAALDAAMKSLDSFDEFTKKLDAFKTLKDDDDPVK
ncbi:Gldg family protein [Candidatus Lokiarchaeum ossiferum]|uniref:Gldg family protein n=1 Tax=Candidatus Lokiarchaeum ossiferum TaxID=2951803 RepID=UPI00352EF512